MSYCTNCKEEMNEHAEICPACGVRQGKVINYCYQCGEPVTDIQEMCTNCGVNPRRIKGNRVDISSSTQQPINLVLATILGLFIPGLPQLLWYNQKTKGVALIIGTIIGYAFLLGWIISILGAIDAYQLGQRVNNGEQLDEWTFFWNK